VPDLAISHRILSRNVVYGDLEFTINNLEKEWFDMFGDEETAL
jgi:hypothetical protein